MKKIRKTGKFRQESDLDASSFLVEYYQAPFLKFHKRIHIETPEKRPHDARFDFWRIVPPGLYSPDEGRGLVEQYMVRVETVMAEVIGKQSLAYYLHLYRRLAPGAIGNDDRPMTIALVRATLEAAFQKYGSAEPCNRVANAAEVDPGAILKGEIKRDARLWKMFEPILNRPQLVLTDFGFEELKEFYALENLAYEIWKGSAVIRTLAKGARLRVSPDAECFSAELSNDLSDLLRVYDGRQRFPSVTATGTVFEPPSTAGNEGIIFLPTYNTNHLPWKAFSKLMRRVGVSLVLPTSTDQNAALNFLWIPFNMLTFYESHRPFSDAFEELHGVKLVSVLSVITALAVRAFSEWQADPARFVRDWQRAYDGPMMPSLCIDKIRDVLPAALRVVSLDTTADQVEVEKVVDYLSWKESKRSSIDLVVPGPHSFFLPYGDSRCFVDYAWILQRLYRLFLDVKLSDQNFKGAAFEELVRRNGSVLPVKPCKAHDGTTKQVDCAMDLGDALLVVECKVKAQSIGWERGASAAIEGRQQFIEEAIGDADEKAFWLAQRPRGANYDVSKYKRILAVVVTPFVEFIWTKSSYYWLSTALPRVLTPTELDTALSDESLSSIALTHQMSAPVMHRQA